MYFGKLVCWLMLFELVMLVGMLCVFIDYDLFVNLVVVKKWCNEVLQNFVVVGDLK